MKDLKKKKCKQCKQVIKNQWFEYPPFFFCSKDCISKFFTKLEKVKDDFAL